METRTVNKEEIKKQIDSIISLMEEQIEAAKEKQALVEKLIETTDRAKDDIVNLKDASAETLSERDKKGPIIALCSAVVLLTLVFGIASLVS